MARRAGSMVILAVLAALALWAPSAFVPAPAYKVPNGALAAAVAAGTFAMNAQEVLATTPGGKRTNAEYIVYAAPVYSGVSDKQILCFLAVVVCNLIIYIQMAKFYWNPDESLIPQAGKEKYATLTPLTKRMMEIPQGWTVEPNEKPGF
eukprot:CAMPEP_0197649122 /NCGR_PEP_ID=MMETSP1338-20131121/28164_1 /TAXON_ID=43686 ORGANISM="Pelagodinium beii, Strain RCC1491" /NCGR_SAMPLE_ID=MMETSP1338 /ASSEMBLY_ACC=CAM_ASM_000754 /LENGTH=148 /DNA_ID=CAMNT_0043223239 /DNA_START=74 /DNA_END=520 /DNA_ORIENTATION=+